MYFDRFPKGNYILPGTKTYKLVSDLFRRVKIRDKIKNEASIYTEYFVSSGKDLNILHKNILAILNYIG